jgi:uncharacterized membrane protein
MRFRNHWTTFILAAIGVVVCLVGVGGFLWAVFSNNLAWAPDQSARDYYLDVGSAFGDGFIMGFFLCFFLVLGVVTLGTLLGFIRNPRFPAEPQPTQRSFRIIPGNRR